MGVNSSKNLSNYKKRSHQNSSSDSSSDEEVNEYFDFSIPEDLLVDVLSHVSAEDLVNNCRLVCKLWKDIIDGHSVWKVKCERENKVVPNIRLEKIPHNYYRLIYLYNPYGSNLLSNPCGEKGLDDWTLVRNSGDGYTIENPPNGAEPVPSEVGSTSCFATSYAPCQKFQIVDLVKSGIHRDVINQPSTKIEVGEWFSARFDCASYYKITVNLLNESYSEGLQNLNVKECLVDTFEFEYNEVQWVGKEWHKVSHTFDNISGTRYVYFEHFGKDNQFWAGHYGSKMTGAYVKVIV